MSENTSGSRYEAAVTDESTIPLLGHGTYRTGGYECFESTREALDVGYRHVDTAMAYENEAAVGRAIEVSDVARDDVFLTTKIKGYPEFLGYDGLLESADGCLKRLGTDYVDLLLIHWWDPAADMEETFAAMDRLVDEGTVRHVGVSNFSVEQMREAMRLAETPILTNQIEYHPYFSNPELVEFCRANDVTVTAYSPLAGGRVVGDERLQSIAAGYGKSTAQVAIRWLIQQENVVTIPKAVTPAHLRENLDVFDFRLTDREMAVIDDLEGPFWYRTNKEGGCVYRFRNRAGRHAYRLWDRVSPLVPDPLVDRLS